MDGYSIWREDSEQNKGVLSEMFPRNDRSYAVQTVRGSLHQLGFITRLIVERGAFPASICISVAKVRLHLEGFTYS